MAWIYEQLTGRLFDADGNLVGVGYSGAGQWKNRPSAQNVKDRGPIPAGSYIVHDPVDTHTHGPYALPLSPHLDNKMFDRAGFLIHGDSMVDPGSASEGCVIQARDVREKIGKSTDRELIVVSGMPQEARKS